MPGLAQVGDPFGAGLAAQEVLQAVSFPKVEAVFRDHIPDLEFLTEVMRSPDLRLHQPQPVQMLGVGLLGALEVSGRPEVPTRVIGGDGVGQWAVDGVTGHGHSATRSLSHRAAVNVTTRFG